MTESQENSFTFTWTIENLKYLYLHEEMKSPKFVANCLDETEWQLECIRKVFQGKLETFLRLTKLRTFPCIIYVSQELSVLNENNEILETFDKNNDCFYQGHITTQHKLKRIDDIQTIRCRLWRKGTESISEQGFCRTRICVERRCFMWTVNDLYLYQRKTDLITMNSKKNPCKSIYLVLNTCKKGNKLQVELINKFSESGYYSDRYPYIHDCEISYTDHHGNVMVIPNQEKWKLSEEDPRKKYPKPQKHDKYYFEFPNQDLNYEVDLKCFKNNMITFHCECDICFGLELNLLDDADNLSTEVKNGIDKREDCCKLSTSAATTTSNFMKDMQQLSVEKQFCDFNLKVQTEIFPVHRAILSARSPVFKAMFSHDMKENAKQSVDIPDLNADTVRRMLMYIYTDDVGDIMWKDAFYLYIAGDKYHMGNLKERCSSVMKSNFHPSNACEILVLADQHADESLKRAAQDYIVDHDVEIIHLDSWKEIERKNSNLGIDVLRQIVIKRQKI